MNTSMQYDCLLGGAVGDAIGLPSEGMTSKRIIRRWPGALKHRMFLGNGMVSDDTEHAVMTFLSLTESQGQPAEFSKRLAKRLRWWFASVPAGIGLATAKSILKLWIGIGPARSGIWSAGNGPLMRAPIIGVHFFRDADARMKHVVASTLITHRDPRALEAAQMVALAAALAASRQTSEAAILEELELLVRSDEMKTRFPILKESLAQRDSVQSFADRICRKPGYVTGFAPDSACVAIFAWLRHRGDYQTAIEAVIHSGGDTDTNAFVAGSISAIDCGFGSIPDHWIKGVCDWPINPTFIRDACDGATVRFPIWPMGIVRNALFLMIVIAHGLRRLLPPY